MISKSSFHFFYDKQQFRSAKSSSSNKLTSAKSTWCDLSLIAVKIPCDDLMSKNHGNKQQQPELWNCTLFSVHKTTVGAYQRKSKNNHRTLWQEKKMTAALGAPN